MLPLLAAAVVSLTFTSPPNDPLFEGSGAVDGSQWNLRGTVDPAHPDRGVRGIDAEGAWAVTAGRPDVLIAILDSGVLLTHEDLADNIAINLAEATGAGLVDLDDDGVLTLAEAATIVTDLDLDGAVTPNDVRIFCENGIDDDGNGYIDDTVGWDFEENDDDPTDFYGHGTGRAGIAAAVADNAIGMAGVCPGCRILPVRMGATFVATPDHLAEAIAYAADRGAASTVMATGALGNSAELRAAVAYADAHGVVQCAAIGNEGSRHHHVPQIFEDVIVVAGIRPDETSYSARWIGSNFGAHASVAAPTFVYATQLDGSYRIEGGTSSSVPHCAAVAALVVSRARDLGLTLTPRQVRSILDSTADDAPAFSAERGYGRLNARAAVEAVALPAPPDARILEPHWYRYAPGGAIPVSIAVAGPATALLEMGYGVEPSSWTPVTGAFVEPVPPPAIAPLDDRLGDDGAVTLRLTATSTAGIITLDRRTFFVRADPDLRAGFPLELGSSVEGAPILADLDGDNRPEIVVATSDGSVRAYRGSGAPVTGWPVTLDPSPIVHATAPAHAGGAVPACCATIFAGLAAGDLDGDHLPEIVATSLDGKVYAWHPDGTRVLGFPHATGAPIWASPVLVDFDGAGTLSIVVASYDRRVHVFDGSGVERSGFPVEARDPTATAPRPGLIGAPAAGDLDGDGIPEIVVATTESSGGTLGARGRVYAFRADGSAVPGFPVKPFGILDETFPVVGSGVPSSPVIADLDGDGRVEIVTGHAAGQITAFSADGSIGRGFDHGAFLDGLSPFGPDKTSADPTWELNLLLLAQPVAADLGNSGHLDVISGTMGLHDFNLEELAADPGEALTKLTSLLSVWRHDGRLRAPFPKPIEGWTLFSGVTIADLDADSLPEILAGSDGGWLHAWNARGDEAPGFPKFTGGWLTTAAAVGDLDADGRLDVVTATREGALYAWTTQGASCVNHAAAATWPLLRHDLRNSGDGRTDATPPATVADARVENGRAVFTAVGDDGFTGAATSYDARWSASPITTVAEFAAASAIPAPGGRKAGTRIEAGAGIPASAHVAVLARDDAGNVSPLPDANAAGFPSIGCVDAPVIHLDGGPSGCRCTIGETSTPRPPLGPMLLALLGLALFRRRVSALRGVKPRASLLPRTD